MDDFLESCGVTQEFSPNVPPLASFCSTIPSKIIFQSLFWCFSFRVEIRADTCVSSEPIRFSADKNDCNCVCGIEHLDRAGRLGIFPTNCLKSKVAIPKNTVLVSARG